MTGADPSAPLPTPGPDRVDWRQVRLVLGARVRLLLRRGGNRPATLVLHAFVLLAATVGVLAVSVGLGFGMRALVASGRTEAAASALHLAALVVFALLAVSPSLGLRGNEFLDVTKLFVYPVGHRTVFAATLVGLLASLPVLMLAAPLVAVVVGYGGPLPVVALNLVVVGLLLAVSVALGQLGLLLFLETFRSRKWRDLSVLIAASLTGGIYAWTRFAFDGSGPNPLFGLVRGFDRVRDWLAPLPPWWAAHAVTGTGALRYLPALGLPALLVWLIHAAARLQERAYYGELQERVRESPAPTGRARRGLLARRLPGALGALVQKDLALVTRVPAVRILLIQQSAFALIPILAVAVRAATAGPEGSALAQAMAFVPAVSYALLLVEMPLLLNPIGLDGTGMVHTLMTPVPRGTLLLAKYVAALLAFGAANAVLVAVLTLAVGLVGGRPVGTAAGAALLNALEALCLVGIAATIGGFFGVLSPWRVGARSRTALQQHAEAGQGCLRALLAGFAVMLTMGVALPVAFAFHHPVLLASLHAGTGSRAWLWVTVPLALSACALFVWGGAGVAGTLLARREEQVAAVLGRSEE